MSSKRFFGPMLDGPAQGKWWESNIPEVSWYVSEGVDYRRWDEQPPQSPEVKRVIYKHINYVLIAGDDPVGFWWPVDQKFPTHEELIRLLYYGYGHKSK